MRVALVSAGSRGDIAPFAALAIALQAAGHEPTLLAHEEFRGLLGDAPVQFMAARGPNPRDILDSVDGRKLLSESKSPRRFARTFSKLIDPAVEVAFEDTLAASEGSDLIVYSPTGFGGFNVAEKLGVQAVQMQLQPAVPSYRYPTVFSARRTLGRVGNRLSHEIGERTFTDAIRVPLNRARANVLGLPPLTASNLIRAQRGLEAPPLLAFDRELVPPPRGWDGQGELTGALLPQLARGAALTPELEAFLAQDGPCIYIGFGSMLIEHPEGLVEAIAEATRRRSIRAVVQRGWGGLAAPAGAEQLLFIDEVDHALLFPRVDAVVHHGGAGTTARAVRSGRPSLVAPLMADQFFWGFRSNELGVGPKPLRCEQITADRLTARLEALLGTPAFRSKAAEVAASIATRDPARLAVAHLETVAGR